MSAYSLLFGAVFGYAAFGYGIPTDHPTNMGLLLVWIAMALIGSTLVGIKNRMMINTRLKPAIITADILVPLALILLTSLLPSSVGLLRGFVVLIVVAVYVSIYVHFLFEGKLVENP